ncbi:MAG: GLPGLI family protein [Muribaculaceae bacterium]|nr:GLPGLI family protein [Muribaculaceae bacterium]
MKHSLLVAIAILLSAAPVLGQQASLKVGYRFSTTRLDGDVESKEMTLLSGPEGSKYYNTMSQIVDSLTSTPEGQKNLRQMQMAAWVVQNPDGSITVDKRRGNVPSKNVNLYVLKDFKDGNFTVYDKYGEDYSVYTEPIETIDWTIVDDSTRTVLGYECIMAKGTYHGRDWTVWFAPEIPVADGPWKLQGLPGLIMLADSKGVLAFEAIGLESVNEAIPPMYKADTYSKIDRKKAMTDYDAYVKNKMAMLKAQFGVVKVESVRKSDGKRVEPEKYNPERYSLEPDYLK